MNDYHIHLKYLDTLTPYHACPKILSSSFYCLMIGLKNIGHMTTSVDPNTNTVVSGLGLHCLLRSVCFNTWGKPGVLCIIHAQQMINNIHVLWLFSLVNV